VKYGKAGKLEGWKAGKLGGLKAGKKGTFKRKIPNIIASKPPGIQAKPGAFPNLESFLLLNWEKHLTTMFMA